MPVISDSNGNYFRIPSSALEEFRISKEEYDKAEFIEDSPSNDDDVQLQEMRMPRVGTFAHQWYSGD